MYRLTLVLLLCSTPLAAQTLSSPDSTPHKTSQVFGASASRLFIPGEGGAGFGVVGFQITDFREGRAGTEIGLYTVPAAIAEGAVVLIPKLAAVWVTKRADVWTFIKVGGWAAFAPSGGGGVLGVYGGGGVLIPAGKRWAIRLEVEPHAAMVAPTHPALVFTVGVASLPK